jgi:hypothetical protein
MNSLDNLISIDARILSVVVLPSLATMLLHRYVRAFSVKQLQGYSSGGSQLICYLCRGVVLVEEADDLIRTDFGIIEWLAPAPQACVRA